MLDELAESDDPDLDHVCEEKDSRGYTTCRVTSSGLFAAKNMNQIKLLSSQTGLTMSSLELVQFINNQRDVGASELAHSDFLKKVQQVLGKNAGNFSSIYVDSMNREKPCYKFPKREACLMAMSYSYELQAKVFDRMTALEAGHATPAIPQTLAQSLCRKAAKNSKSLD